MKLLGQGDELSIQQLYPRERERQEMREGLRERGSEKDRERMGKLRRERERCESKRERVKARERK